MIRSFAINPVAIGWAVGLLSAGLAHAGGEASVPAAAGIAWRVSEALVADVGGPPSAHCASAGLDQMLAALPGCQTDAVFLSNLGYRLNREGRYAEAMDHLERALMLNPELKGARIDYALALAGNGDVPAALALLDALLGDPDLPEPLAPVLRRQRLQIARLSPGSLPVGAAATSVADPAGELKVRRTAAVRLGHDSNLLGAPNLASLTLTPPGGALTLALDEAYLSRPGLYLRSDAGLELSHSSTDGVGYEAVLNLQAKRSPSEQAANARQYELFVERSQPPRSSGQAGHYAQISTGGVEVNTGVRYRVLRIAGGGEWTGLRPTANGERCATRLGAEWQDRELASTPILSGRYLGATAQWRCSPEGGRYWQLAAQYGQDMPKDGSRPGGRQAQYALRFTGVWPLRPWLAWAVGSAVLDVEHSRTQDSAGYTPLLADGAARRVSRSSARLEWQRGLGEHHQGFVGVQWLWQAANIELFTQRSWGPYAGLRVVW